MRTIIPVILLITVTPVHSQTFSEWFRQNKTQLKYLALQIAALKANSAATEAGNQIAETGTQSISSTNQADFDLHQAYILSLSTVNPALRQLVPPITQYYNTITNLTRSHPNQFLRNLQNEADKEMGWLRVLTTDNNARMKDDQRLTAIQNISQRMQQILIDALTIKNQLN